jgi:hypothetical protein
MSETDCKLLPCGKSNVNGLVCLVFVFFLGVFFAFFHEY